MHIIRTILDRFTNYAVSCFTRGVRKTMKIIHIRSANFLTAKTKHNTFIIYLGAVLCLLMMLCGCSKQNTQMVINNDSSYSGFGIGDVRIQSYCDNWMNLEMGNIGTEYATVELDDNKKVVLVYGNISVEDLDKYPIYVEGNKIDSLEAFNNLFDNNAESKSYTAEYLDGEITGIFQHAENKTHEYISCSFTLNDGNANTEHYE